MTGRLFLLFKASALAALLAWPAQTFAAQGGAAQAPPGRIKGVVLDPFGAAIPGVKVRFEADGARREATSDTSGRFEVELPEGAYHVSAGQVGFLNYERKGLKVKAGKTKRVKVVFKCESPCGIIS